MGLGPQRKDSKTFGTTVYGLTHPTAESHRMGYLEIFCLSGVVLGPIDVPKSKKFKKRVRTIC